MNDLIEEFLAWCTQNGLREDELGGGVPPGDIDALEATTGVDLGEDVRTFYRRLNGLPDWLLLRGTWRILPLDLVEAEYVENLEVFDGLGNPRAEVSGPIRDHLWNSRWVPFCTNGAGDALCLDFDPAPGGTLGQVISFWHEEGEQQVLSPSFRAFFAAFIEELQGGVYTLEDALNYRGTATY